VPNRAQYFWLFLSFSGRIDRLVYFLANLLIGVIQVFPIYKAMRVIIDLGPETMMNSSLEQIVQLSPDFALWWSIASLLTFVMLWPYLALGTKRFHDVGWHGIFAVTLVIPLLQMVAFIALSLIPGNSGPNRYGRPNAPAGA